MKFRVRYYVLGGHVHCRLYVGVSEKTRGFHALCGHFTVRLDEFDALKRAFQAEFIDEGAAA